MHIFIHVLERSTERSTVGHIILRICDRLGSGTMRTIWCLCHGVEAREEQDENMFIGSGLREGTDASVGLIPLINVREEE